MADPSLIASRLAPIGLMAFVQSEKLVSSGDSIERWMPIPGPLPEPNTSVRFTVFAWDLAEQGWSRGLSFDGAEEAGLQAAAMHNFLVDKWKMGEAI